MASKVAETSEAERLRTLELFGFRDTPQPIRAEWDEQLGDPPRGGRMAYALWNYRLQRSEWAYHPLRVAVERGAITDEQRRDYLPPDWVDTEPPARYLEMCRKLREWRARKGDAVPNRAEFAGTIGRD